MTPNSVEKQMYNYIDGQEVNFFKSKYLFLFYKINVNDCYKFSYKL